MVDITVIPYFVILAFCLKKSSFLEPEMIIF